MATKDKIGAIAFYECSAMKRTNIKEVFEAAARYMDGKRTGTIKKEGCCNVL